MILIVWSACLSYAQGSRVDTTATTLAQLDSITQAFTAEDSLAIFDLLDSLIQADPSILGDEEESMLAVRFGYNSNITSDNRTFNISQFGLAPGLSYYHKSGLYADITTYWSQEYQPNFYLTVPSVGYLNTFGKHYSILAEYNHFFYNQPEDSTVLIPYTNSIGVSNYFEFKPLMFRLDYYLYFGERTNHRLMPSIGLNLVKTNWLGFDRVMFFPAFAILLGSEQVSTWELYDRNERIRRRIWNAFHPNSPPLLPYYEVVSTEFGVMNYGFTFPISFTKKDWSFLISYAYNMPRPLPGETLSIESTGYLSFSVTRYFRFKK